MKHGSVTSKIVDPDGRNIKAEGLNILSEGDEDGRYFVLACSSCKSHYSLEPGDEIHAECETCRNGGPCDCIVEAGQVIPVHSPEDVAIAASWLSEVASV